MDEMDIFGGMALPYSLKRLREIDRANLLGRESVPSPSVQFPTRMADQVPAYISQMGMQAIPSAATPSYGPNLAGLTAGVASALPRSQAAASPSPNVGASAGPQAPRVAANVPGQASAAAESVNSSPFEARRKVLQDQLSKIEDTPPDYSAAQAYARQRGMQGNEQLGAAILAGVGPSFTQKLQPTFARQYEAAQKPLAMEGAIITPDGQVVQDPQFKRMQMIQNLSRRLSDLDNLEQRTNEMHSREMIAHEKRQTELLLRQMMTMAATAARGAGGAGASGLGGPSTSIGKLADGRDVYRNNKDPTIVFAHNAETGQPEPVSGKIFEKRDLGQTTMNELTKGSAQYTALDSLANAYHRGYERIAAGTGGLETWWGQNMKLLSSKQLQERANWFGNWQTLASELRHGLFGSALTKPELESFNKANITEDMTADMINTRLIQQRAAAARAVEKLRAVYGRNYQAHLALPESVNLTDVAPGQIVPARDAPGKSSPSPQGALPNARGAQFERQYGGGL